jgi:hypothetical protein
MTYGMTDACDDCTIGSPVARRHPAIEGRTRCTHRWRELLPPAGPAIAGALHLARRDAATRRPGHLNCPGGAFRGLNPPRLASI